MILALETIMNGLFPKLILKQNYSMKNVPLVVAKYRSISIGYLFEINGQFPSFDKSIL